MIHPCRQCREMDLPGCRSGCLRLQAWNDMKELAEKDKARKRLLDGYITDACRAAKRGARRRDGRYIR